jgi:hypothetical protein
LDHLVSFVKGDFMVSYRRLHTHIDTQRLTLLAYKLPG